MYNVLIDMMSIESLPLFTMLSWIIDKSGEILLLLILQKSIICPSAKYSVCYEPLVSSWTCCKTSHWEKKWCPWSCYVTQFHPWHYFGTSKEKNGSTLRGLLFVFYFCMSTRWQFSKIAPGWSHFDSTFFSVQKYNSKCWKLVFRVFPFMGMFD